MRKTLYNPAMRTTTIRTLATLLLLGAVVLVLHIRHERIAVVPDGTPAQGAVSPVPAPLDHTFILHMHDATALPVRDFLKDADVTADARNPGVYYLGNTMSTNPRDAQPRYIVSYEHSIQFFKIVLLQNPLGEVRRDAETYLEQKLGVDSAQLCNLSYKVATPAAVSQVFSDLDLKWSMCQDSVTLR